MLNNTTSMLKAPGNLSTPGDPRQINHLMDKMIGRAEGGHLFPGNRRGIGAIRVNRVTSLNMPGQSSYQGSKGAILMEEEDGDLN
jgi:hypothetical protein